MSFSSDESRLRKKLGGASKAVQDPKLLKKSGNVIVKLVKKNAPKRSGALADSVKAETEESLIVRVEKSYAKAVEKLIPYFLRSWKEGEKQVKKQLTKDTKKTIKEKF